MEEHGRDRLLESLIEQALQYTELLNITKLSFERLGDVTRDLLDRLDNTEAATTSTDKRLDVLCSDLNKHRNTETSMLTKEAMTSIMNDVTNKFDQAVQTLVNQIGLLKWGSWGLIATLLALIYTLIKMIPK